MAQHAAAAVGDGPAWRATELWHGQRCVQAGRCGLLARWWLDGLVCYRVPACLLTLETACIAVCASHSVIVRHTVPLCICICMCAGLLHHNASDVRLPFAAAGAVSAYLSVYLLGGGSSGADLERQLGAPWCRYPQAAPTGEL